jgi:hypothetical protein
MKCNTDANDCFSWFYLADIDRCLKKVQEGVESFEETWKKVLCMQLKLYGTADLISMCNFYDWTE